MRRIYISCLLKDNMIVSYHISGNPKKEPQDYYKYFYYAGFVPEYDKYEVKWMAVSVPEDISSEFNDYIFEVTAKEFYKQWKIHPKHWGSPAYQEELK